MPITIRNQQLQQMGDANPGHQSIKPCEATKAWVEVKLMDDDDNPVPGAEYRIRLPDASTSEGTLDDKGAVKIDGIIAGQCVISFPEIDGREWNPA